jgi:hypothetical protein
MSKTLYAKDWMQKTGARTFTRRLRARIVLGDPMPERVKLLPEPGELGA